MAWRWSVCGTAEVVWKPRFLWQWPSAHLHCFGLLFLIFLLSIPRRFSMGFRSGEFADQSSTPTPWCWCFWQSGQVTILLENKISIFKKLKQKEAWSAPKCLGKRVQWSWFSKNSGPTPADDIAPQIITDCGNLTLDLTHATWAMSFSTLPTNSRTSVS